MLVLLPGTAGVLVSQMTELVLKKIGKHFGVDPWLESKNDYLVLNDAGRIIGRIVKRTCSPNGRPWAWTITVRRIGGAGGCNRTARAASASKQTASRRGLNQLRAFCWRTVQCPRKCELFWSACYFLCWRQGLLSARS